MRKILFIINPVAGKHNGMEIVPKIKDKLKKYPQINYEIQISVRNRMITNLVEGKLKDHSITDIIAVGGDGTLMEVINGTNRKNINVGIIPAGSGNDFAKTINIPENIDLALDKIVEPDYKSIYLGEINDIKFINSIGIGLDSKVLIEKEKSGIKNGFINYFLSTIKAIISYKADEKEYFIDNKEKLKKILILTINNGKYFGNGMLIAPGASPYIKELYICAIEDMSIGKALFNFPKIYKGKHLKLREVEITYGDTVKINFEEDTPVNIDGTLTYMKKIEIKKSTEKIKFIV